MKIESRSTAEKKIRLDENPNLRNKILDHACLERCRSGNTLRPDVASRGLFPRFGCASFLVPWIPLDIQVKNHVHLYVK